jgi:Nucleotidyl transferase AbiEii toxin, Type IV TA system
MPLIREQDDLTALVAAAAELLGLPAGVVEKDYWVTQALRALQAEYADEFIFKGGTSLSKAYGLIERFSEDIDILVRKRDEANSARYRRIDAMTATAAGAVGDPGEREKQSAERSGLHRTELLHYGSRSDRPALMLSAIRLDIGIIGGIEPHGQRPIATLLGDVLQQERDIDPGAFDDLARFEVPVLHPGRTLVEKLLLAHTAATRCSAQRELLDELRVGRHYYDIHCLLGHEESRLLLADRATFRQVLADAVRISTEHFDGVEQRPEEGFAASLAFCAAGELRDRLERHYEETMEVFYFGQQPHPPFASVCGRVAESAELL